MSDFEYIKKQLESFTRRYYMNELLKGAILFSTIWLLYFLFMVFIEYFFWLSPKGRSVLFWLFIIFSAALFFRFVVIPLSRLFRISKGIDHQESSRIIGRHFPEVNDKLLNVIQLQHAPQQSDLLLAGIAQKSRELKPIPFKMAVNFNKSLQYLKYAVFPVIIILAVMLSGNMDMFSESYSRVVHYNTAYEPPAAFSFHLKNEVLRVEQGEHLQIEVETRGRIMPERVEIHFSEQMYFLKNAGPSSFIFDFQDIREDFIFYLSGNGITSRPYEVEVVKVPTFTDFEIGIDYPGYIEKASQTIRGTGNIHVPVGSQVSWNLRTRNTEEVVFTSQDSTEQFVRMQDNFTFSKMIFGDLNYQIATSNSQVKDYEKLEYSITVTEDAYPDINVIFKKDSITEDIFYFFGQVSDDYGISRLELVYYPEGDENSSQRVEIPRKGGEMEEFLYTFPGEIDLAKGINYHLYFKVFDNDGINGAKASKSEVFNYRMLSDREEEEKQLLEHGKSIDNLSESLEQMKGTEGELEELSRLQKEKESLNYNDRKKLGDFLERQKLQSQMMRNYSDKLKKTLEQKGEESSDPFKKELDKRLEVNEKKLEENESLLEELQEYSDKISREELSERLEALSNKNSNEQKNLEQILELTKRFYVQEKARKLANDLSELADKQDGLSLSDSINTPDNQNKLRLDFEKISEEMEKLENENRGLKKPYGLEIEKQDETDVREEQEQAQEHLKKNNKREAKDNQGRAARKMEQMADKLKSSQEMSQGDQLHADIESLRQILDNLMVFSFEQEELLLDFRKMRAHDPSYASKLKEQQTLREHFEYVDDSLFSLALSNPMISEKITSKLTDIDFDIKKSLERLAQNELARGTSSQQYVMAGTNELALLLSEVLDNMQEMVNPGVSQGDSGSEIQLQDIIMSQEELKKQMQGGILGEEQGQPNTGDGERKDGAGGNKKEHGDDLKEEMSERLYEIFKQQQLLKQQLEISMKENGLNRDHQNIIPEMDEIEKDILSKGFNRETLERMNAILHKLMELEDAVLIQDEEEQRRAKTNLKGFEGSGEIWNPGAKDYFNSSEILNRQSLPLHRDFKAKVKKYFESAND